jgi:hypothetical protein
MQLLKAETLIRIVAALCTSLKLEKSPQPQAITIGDYRLKYYNLNPVSLNAFPDKLSV